MIRGGLDNTWVCLFILSWFKVPRITRVSSEKNCCYSFLSSSEKNLNDLTFRTTWLSVIEMFSRNGLHEIKILPNCIQYPSTIYCVLLNKDTSLHLSAISLLVASNKSYYSLKNMTTLECSYLLARSSGVSLSALRGLPGAPCMTSSLTQLEWPFIAASWSGTHPVLGCLRVGSAPFDIRNLHAPGSL